MSDQSKVILGNCFQSYSSIWANFLSRNEETNILYYPSAGQDFRPFVFSKKQCLMHCEIEDLGHYIEPTLLIFSDYFPYNDSTLFDTKVLFSDANTFITIEEYCELIPLKGEYNYFFNTEYIECNSSSATGKAIYFNVKIWSHVTKEYYCKDAIYFFYENTNLIDQLFLRHKLQVSHIV